MSDDSKEQQRSQRCLAFLEEIDQRLRTGVLFDIEPSGPSPADTSQRRLGRSDNGCENDQRSRADDSNDKARTHR